MPQSQGFDPAFRLSDARVAADHQPCRRRVGPDEREGSAPKQRRQLTMDQSNGQKDDGGKKKAPPEAVSANTLGTMKDHLLLNHGVEIASRVLSRVLEFKTMGPDVEDQIAKILGNDVVPALKQGPGS